MNFWLSQRHSAVSRVDMRFFFFLEEGQAGKAGIDTQEKEIVKRENQQNQYGDPTWPIMLLCDSCLQSHP